jgi:hypothetical protein
MALDQVHLSGYPLLVDSFPQEEIRRATRIRDFIDLLNTQFGDQDNHSTTCVAKQFRTDNNGKYLAVAPDLRRMGIVHDSAALSPRA